MSDGDLSTGEVADRKEYPLTKPFLTVQERDLAEVSALLASTLEATRGAAPDPPTQVKRRGGRFRRRRTF